MRIAYITQSYPPMVSGAAIVAKNLAESMATRGHQVLVIAASDRGESYKTISEDLTILRLSSMHNPLRVGQRFILSPRQVFKKALHDFQPDIIHSHCALQLGVQSLGFARRRRIPILLTIHALPNFAAKYLPPLFSDFQPAFEASLWMYAWIVLRQFDMVTTPTPTTTCMISAMTGVRPISISNGVDLNRFSSSRLSPDFEAALRTRLNLPFRAPVILHVGRLDADKRVDQVIRASALAMRNTDAHLLIVGDGCQKSSLINLCQTLGIKRRCHFPGYVSMQEGLPEVYRLADLIVTASEIETQGIVLLEAAASGLPIVAVRATCIPEVVHDGENGYLAESNDISGFAEAITHLLTNPEKACEMGRAGRHQITEHNIHATFDIYERHYKKIIRKKALQHSSVKAYLNIPAQKLDFRWAITKWQKLARDWLNL